MLQLFLHLKCTNWQWARMRRNQSRELRLLLELITSPSNETDELEELIATRGKFVAQFVRLHFLVWFWLTWKTGRRSWKFLNRDLKWGKKLYKGFSKAFQSLDNRLNKMQEIYRFFQPTKACITSFISNILWFTKC